MANQNDGQVRYRIVIDDSDVEKDMKKAEKVVSRAGKGLAKAGGMALAGITASIGALGSSALKFGSEFEKSMSEVSATMGFTAQDLNDSTSEASKSFEQLEKTALKMGSTTKFSASESAEALNYLALAGMDVQTSIETLPKVLQLATAGGLELGYTADVVTDSMSALGLSVEDLDKFTDQLAKTSQKSNTTIGMLGEAILTVGGTAKALKGGITEMNLNLGLLADNGVKASEGGTALRNIILSLSAPTDKASKLLKDLGVNTLDADGNLRNLNQIMFEINEATKELGSGEKAGILNKIFNKTDLKSVNALLGTTEERIAQFTKELENAQGTAKAMSETMGDNLIGVLTNMKSAFEGFSIGLFKGDDELAKSSLESLLGGLDKVVDQYLVPLISNIAKSLPQILVVLIDALVEIIPQLLDALVEALPPLILGLVDGLVELFPKLIETFEELIPKLLVAIAEGTPILLDGFLKLVISIFELLANNVPFIATIIPELIKTMVSVLIENMPLLLDAFFLLITELAKYTPEIITELLPIIPAIITALADALIKGVPQIIKAGSILLGSLLAETPAIIANILITVATLIKDIVRAIVLQIPEFFKVGQELMTGFWNGIADKKSWINKKIKKMLTGFTDNIKDFFGIQSPSKLFEYFGEMNMQGFGIGFENEEMTIGKRINGVFDGLVGDLNPATATTNNRSINNSVMVTGNTISNDNINTIGNDFMNKLKRDGLY